MSWQPRRRTPADGAADPCRPLFDDQLPIAPSGIGDPLQPLRLVQRQWPLPGFCGRLGFSPGFVEWLSTGLPFDHPVVSLEYLAYAFGRWHGYGEHKGSSDCAKAADPVDDSLQFDA
jgi:hypothetical protein